MAKKPTTRKTSSAPGEPAGQRTLLDAAAVAGALKRMARRIAEALPADCPVAFVGLRSRGDELATRLIAALADTGRPLLHGTLDITLYRDDLSKRAVQPTVQATEIDFDLDGACVILVDDVLNTGRTIRAAMDALMDYGRPAMVRLAVLVDRGGRELPIAPDFVGARLDLPAEETRRVYVEMTEADGRDRVYLK